jgi:hypothetical protein
MVVFDLREPQRPQRLIITDRLEYRLHSGLYPMRNTQLKLVL